MANFKEGTVTFSAVTHAGESSTAVDVRGYNSIAIQLKFATCAGSTNSATVKMQTSNDNSNWADCTPTLASEANASSFSGGNYFIYLPDNATANEFGFGKYIRFTIAGSEGDPAMSVSCTITYLLKG